MNDYDVQAHIDSNNLNLEYTELVKPTLFEILVKIIPGNNLVITIFLGLIAGPLGVFLFTYLLTGDLTYSFYDTFGVPIVGIIGLKATHQQFEFFYSNIFWYSFILYTAFTVISLREKLLKTDSVFSTLAVDGRKAVSDSFNLVSKKYPQIIIAGYFMWIYLSSIPELQVNGTLIISNLPVYLLRSLIRSLIFASFLWIYISSLWGLYRYGNQKLVFKSFHIDTLLGLRELGSFSFYFSKVYLFGLALFIAHVFFGDQSGNSASINILFMSVLPPLGLAFFLTPLIRIHNTMVKMKKHEMDKLRNSFETIFTVSDDQISETAQLNQLLAYEALERKVSSISTWPFEIPLMSKLIIITISVTATIIAKYLMIFLGL